MSQVTFDFRGKNFVVIGASSGIGRQVAENLLQARAHVLALARRKELLEQYFSAYPLASVTSYDVMHPEILEEIIHIDIERYGKLDGMAYTAGITGLTPLRAHDESLEQKMQAVNYQGFIDALQVVSRKKYAKPQSAFVVVSSTAAKSGAPGMMTYSATKAALLAAVQCIAKEIGRKGQRINAVSPGWVDTEMTRHYLSQGDTVSESEMKRYVLGLGVPQDISAMILYLLSDAARWITGSNFVVDGGFSAG